jgi:hypothetical protein
MIGRKLIALAVSFLLMAGFLALFSTTAGTESELDSMPDTSARGTYPDDGYFDVDGMSYDGNHYPGDTENFHFRLESNYNGENYDPNSAGIFNSTTLFNVTMSFTGIFDENMNPVVNDPVVWVENNVYNNDGDGYGIPWLGQQQNYYADDGTENQEFDIKIENITPGNYFIGVQERFRYLDSWDGATQYNYTNFITDNDYVGFTVNSAIGPFNSDFEYTFRATRDNNNNEALYAGAEFERFTIKNLNEPSGQITEIAGELTMDMPEYFSVVNPICTLNEIGAGPNLVNWRINVDKHTPPGEYIVNLQFSYTRTITGDVYVVTETVMPHPFTVLYTPVLMPPLPPAGEEMADPIAIITQKDVNGSFTVDFVNDGNTPLRNLVVRLDLDNTKYIVESEFYYNENANAATMWPELSVDFGDQIFGVGETAEAEYNMINLVHFLPPGKYMIPVDYTCTYLDEGATGNPSGEVAAGYWDDGNQQLLHRTIMQAITYPEDFVDPHLPYIIVEVQEDADGIDVEANIGSGQFTQTQGANNRYIFMQVFNYEYYDFHDMTYYIYADASSPFDVPGGNGTATTLPPIHRPNLNDGGMTWIGSDSFWFYADIKDNANPGINYVQVDITGYNQFLQPVTKTLWMQININSKQPRFEVTQVVTGNVSDDMEVTVTATIKNVGEGAALGVGAYFVTSSTGYIGPDDSTPIGDLMPGDSLVYEFSVRTAAESYIFHGAYYGNIYFEYTDEMDVYYPLFSGGSEYITYYVYSKLPDMLITNVNAPLIDDGDQVTATITVANIGGSTARNVTVMVAYNSALFQISGGQPLGDIEAGDDATFTVTITALDEIADYTTYSFTLYFSYQNIEGRTLTYSEGEKESFSIRTKDDVSTSEQLQIVEEKGKILDEGLAMLLLGVLILVGLIIFAMIFVKASRGEQPAKTEPAAWEEKPAAPRAKPVEKKDDDWEEEEDEDEEEPEEDEEDEDEENEDDEEEW